MVKTAPEPTPVDDTEPAAEPHGEAEPRWHPDLVTFIAIGIYLVVFAYGLWRWGVPLNRERLALWLALGMLAASIRHPKRFARGFVVDWLPLFSVLLVYDYLRGAADELGRPIHMDSLINFDEWLFGGQVLTVRLQDGFLDLDRMFWWDYVAWAAYLSHFLASFVIAAFLWVRNRARFRQFAARFVALSYLGFLTYMIYPAAPPWYASRVGRIPVVYRTATRGWDALGWHTAGTLFEKGQRSVNIFAAVPSLHAAFAALICAFFWGKARWPLRTLLAGYAFTMGVALVYTAEHWVIDILLGWLYVAIVMIVAAWLAPRWARARPRIGDWMWRRLPGSRQPRRLVPEAHSSAGASGPGAREGGSSK